jgi:hypothetical protein
MWVYPAVQNLVTASYLLQSSQLLQSNDVLLIPGEGDPVGI